MLSRTDRGRRAAWPTAAALLIVVAGCSAPNPGQTSPPPPTGEATPTPDAASAYRTIAAQVAALRGLDAPDKVEPSVIDRDTLRANLLAYFDRDNPADLIERTERIEKALGLLPPDSSLRDLYLDMQGSQVIGYYDPAARELFIVSADGGLGPTERLTYAHEFTHELQDLAFDLDSLGLDALTEDTDRALAILALVEGDATSVQTEWMLGNLTDEELGQVAAEALDPAMLEVLGRTPAILLETSIFSYQSGASFVADLSARGGPAAVDAAYAHLPESTEQIIHPEKYAAGEGPIDVGLPDDLATRFGAGWSAVATDSMGELQLRVWLRQGGLAGDVARVAAEGWGGDRLALVEGPAGDLLVLVTEWDSTADADEFRAAAEAAIDGSGLQGLVTANDRRVVIALGADRPPFLQLILWDLAGVIEG